MEGLAHHPHFGQMHLLINLYMVKLCCTCDGSGVRGCVWCLPKYSSFSLEETFLPSYLRVRLVLPDGFLFREDGGVLNRCTFLFNVRLPLFAVRRSPFRLGEYPIARSSALLKLSTTVNSPSAASFSSSKCRAPADKYQPATGEPIVVRPSKHHIQNKSLPSPKLGRRHLNQSLIQCHC
jgi:hypothetical protein